MNSTPNHEIKSSNDRIDDIRVKLQGAKALACLLDIAHNADDLPEDQHWDATLLLTTIIDEALAYIEGGQS